MTLKDALLQLFDREVAISKKVLANVPEGKNDWKPHDKSMAFGYLAQLVAMMPVWIVDGLRSARARPRGWQPETGTVEDGGRPGEAA